MNESSGAVGLYRPDMVRLLDEEMNSKYLREDSKETIRLSFLPDWITLAPQLVESGLGSIVVNKETGPHANS